MKKLVLFLTVLLFCMTSFSIVNAQQDGGENPPPGSTTIESTSTIRMADRFCLFGGSRCKIIKTKTKMPKE